MGRGRQWVLLFAGVVLFWLGWAEGADPRKWAQENLKDLLALYEHFHRTPELSFHELAAVGAEVTVGMGGLGVVGVLKNGPGPVLMWRTDLDALPVEEKTALAYASRVRAKTERGLEVGVMHACGHDVHMTNLVGLARFLAAHREAWQGTVLFVGQPAEERGAGAKAMLADGLFARFPQPDFALALHVDAELAAGKVGYRSGYAMARVDSVDITVLGRGGHGSAPHTTIDPVVQAAHLVLDLQTIVSREVSPLEAAVVTVGALHCGTKHNIIGDRCHLQLTVRSYKPKVRERLLAAIRRKALAAAASFGAPKPHIKVSEGTPALKNDGGLVQRLVPVFQKVLGEENVVLSEPSMGGEDFSRYGLAGVPILMFRLGSVGPGRLEAYRHRGERPPSLHSPFYYPDPEPTLLTGVTVSGAAVLELLGVPRGKLKPKKRGKYAFWLF